MTSIKRPMVGILAGLFLVATHSWAQPGGFEAGKRSFSNPFGNAPPSTPPPPPGSDFFDDEDDDDEGDPDEFFGGPPQAGGTPPSASGAYGSGAGGPGYSASGGISAGGDTTNQVISKHPAKPLDVDTETGDGSKEIITDFNFPDADIMDLAKTMGKLTGKNFIVDKDVKGRVTIISNSAITVSDAWKAFLTALDMNGFTLIPSGKYIRIARQRDARDKQIRTYTGESAPSTDALITRVFALKYIGAEEIARVFRSFSPANSRIIAHEQTNTVIVTDTGSNIAKLAKMLEFLDIEGYDAGIEVLQVKFASAVEISKLIDTLLPGTGGAPGPKSPGGGGGGFRSNFAARRTKEGGVINTIIADERTNSLIVHANQKGVQQVLSLISRLDKKIPAPIGGGKIHVVYLQFADAEQISTTLNNISSQAGGARPGGGGGPGGIGTNPQENVLFEGQIKVSPDKATNSLVITASPNDFVTVQRVINRLDIPRDELYAEIVIMEMAISRNFQFSTNLILPSKGIALTPNTDLAEFLMNPLAAKGAIIGFKQGAEVPVKIAGQEFKVSSMQGLVRALQQNAQTNILATPQILTMDNVEASFESAEKIPVPTTTAVSGTVSSGVTRESIALSVTLKPQINKVTNYVKLDIQTKIADISGREVPDAVKNSAFATLERTAKTSIMVADEDTVVLGGLIRDKTQEVVSKVPLLGDIPLLGWLFKSRRTESEKSNLIIFITPHIIKQYDKIRAILDKKLKERDDFIEKNAGGEDPMRNYRDEMIRKLPDISSITSYKPKTTVSLSDDGAVPVPAASPDSSTATPGTPADPNVAVPVQPDPQMEMAPPPPPAEEPGMFPPGGN